MDVKLVVHAVIIEEKLETLCVLSNCPTRFIIPNGGITFFIWCKKEAGGVDEEGRRGIHGEWSRERKTFL
jgi:hypothetical protein